MTKQHKALAAVIACVLLWGLSFISIKIAVAVIPPMTLGALRFALAIVLLYLIKKKYAPEEKIRKEDLPLLVGAGLTGVTLYFFFENNGVAMIPASEASIIVGSIPVITLVAEAVKNKAISLIAIAGALISLAGVALVAGVSFSLSGNAAGYFFMAGACVSWVCYCFFTDPLFARRSRIYIVFWQSVIGFIGFLPFTFFEIFSKTSLKNFIEATSLTLWGNVLFLGIFCSAFGYWLYTLALKDLGVGTATLFINLIPVVSAVGGFFILGERLMPIQWLGAAMVLAGVYLAMAVPKHGK
jgi:drug/metabolite transporter (DMT)-like permease